MGLRDLGSIDMVLGPTPHAKCTLVILDTEQHSNQGQRFENLVKKLLAYLNYVYSPQFAEDHPGISPKDVLIGVMCHQPPNELMVDMKAIQPHGEPQRNVRVATVQYTPGGTLPWFILPADAGDQQSEPTNQNLPK